MVIGLFGLSSFETLSSLLKTHSSVQYWASRDHSFHPAGPKTVEKVVGQLELVQSHG